MQTPIYKCPDCGAKVIYNEKRNSWKCAKCGLEFSEYDVFIQGLEEWKDEAANSNAEADFQDHVFEEDFNYVGGIPLLSDDDDQIPPPLLKPKVHHNSDRIMVRQGNSSDSIQENNASEIPYVLKKYASEISRLSTRIKFKWTTISVLSLLLASLLSFFFWEVDFVLFLAGSVFLFYWMYTSSANSSYKSLIDDLVKSFKEMKEYSQGGLVCSVYNYEDYLVVPDAHTSQTADNFEFSINSKDVFTNKFSIFDTSNTKEPAFKGQGFLQINNLEQSHEIQLLCGNIGNARPNTENCRFSSSFVTSGNIKVSLCADTSDTADIWNIRSLDGFVDSFMTKISKFGAQGFLLKISVGETVLIFPNNQQSIGNSKIESDLHSQFMTMHHQISDLIELAAEISKIEIKEK